MRNATRNRNVILVLNILYFRVDLWWGIVFNNVNKCQSQADRVSRRRIGGPPR